MQLFLLTLHSPQTAVLEAEEARHCLKVLRHRVGDEIDCIDGTGTYYRARITGSNRDQVQLAILEQAANWGEHPYEIRLLVSPLRLRDRFEWLIEKAVELGATEIVPVICRHTLDHARFKPERMEKIMISAMKQCKRSRLTRLHEAVPYAEAIGAEPASMRLIAQADATPSLPSLTGPVQEAKSVSVLIGPEGDFSPEELAQAIQAGWQPVHLGNQRLRAETAAIHGLSGIKLLKGY
jgi:16S rRNA (uracil1498-N3)-methyltransferase